jgi:hypothetical protein
MLHRAALRTELTPLTHDQRARLPDSSENPSSLQDAGELKQSATTLNLNSERLDRLLTAGFTLSPSSLPANHNFADIGPFMSNLDREENALRSTIERLQTFGQADAHPLQSCSHQTATSAGLSQLPGREP